MRNLLTLLTLFISVMVYSQTNPTPAPNGIRVDGLQEKSVNDSIKIAVFDENNILKYWIDKDSFDSDIPLNPFQDTNFIGRPYPYKPSIPVGTGYEAQIRELGNTVFDKNTNQYIMLYSGNTNPTAGLNSHVYWATSTNGEDWVKNGQLLSIPIGHEDPFLVIIEQEYFIFTEIKSSASPSLHDGVGLFKGSNIEDLEYLGKILDATEGAWDSTDVSSPTVFLESGIWYMFYEGRDHLTSGSNLGMVGLATSVNGVDWTKAPEPVVTIKSEDSNSPVQFLNYIVPDDILKIDNTYYMICHGNYMGVDRAVVLFSKNLESGWKMYKNSYYSVENYSTDHLAYGMLPIKIGNRYKFYFALETQGIYISDLINTNTNSSVFFSKDNENETNKIVDCGRDQIIRANLTTDRFWTLNMNNSSKSGVKIEINNVSEYQLTLQLNGVSVDGSSDDLIIQANSSISLVVTAPSSFIRGTSSNFIQKPTEGTAGQVLTTDGVGNVSWGDMPTDLSELTDNDNLLFSRSYNDLTDTPSIPTTTSELTNNGEDGSNPFITALDIPAPELQDLQSVLDEGGVAILDGSNPVVIVQQNETNATQLQHTITSTDAELKNVAQASGVDGSFRVAEFQQQSTEFVSQNIMSTYYLASDGSAYTTRHTYNSTDSDASSNLFVSQSDGIDIVRTELTIATGGNTILDDINEKGISYISNYSANGILDDRWIPDYGAVKNYTDTAVATKLDLAPNGSDNLVDQDNKLNPIYLPPNIMHLQGAWDAGTNTPELSNGTGIAGYIYEVTVAGTTDFGAGDIEFALGDWAVYGNDGIWYKSPNTGEVVGVKGEVESSYRKGLVNLSINDIIAPASDNFLVGGTSGVISRKLLGTDFNISTVNAEVPMWVGEWTSMSSTNQPTATTLVARTSTGAGAFTPAVNNNEAVVLSQLTDAIDSIVVPAQVNLIEGDNITITGTYPDLTITSSDTSWSNIGGDQSDISISGFTNDSGFTTNTGTVTSVGVTVPVGLTVSGTPITTAGVVDIDYTAGYQGYTSVEATKLSGIEEGAEVNIQSDWNATSGDAQILNKPTLPSTVTVEGSDFFYFKNPSNTTETIQKGDVAKDGFYSTSTFINIMVYSEGDPTLFSSWIIINEVTDITTN